MKNRLSMFFFCKIILLFCLLSGTSYGKTIHVPKDYSTIKSAVTNASSGDVILIAPGTYRENGIDVDKKLTIASLYYTTGDKQYIDKTIINGGRSTVFETIYGKGVNVEINGLTFTNATKPVVINDLAVIKNNIFTDNGGDAISFESNGYGYAGYNIIDDTSDDGIDVDGKRGYYTIEHNIIRNNGDDGIEIRLYKYSGPTITYTINNNIITGNDENGIQLIDYDDVSDRVFYIHNNVFANNAMVGLGCMPDGDTREDYGGSYMKERVYLYNNTIVGNVVGVTGADNMIALNNIIADNTDVGIKRFKGDSVVGYSIFYNNGTHMKDCTTSSGILLNTNPRYDSQYHLLDESPCIDRGTAYFVWDSEVVLDIPTSGYTGTAPDLGAYEYGSESDSSTNQAPSVYAGSLEILYEPTNFIDLPGRVTDDGLPNGTLDILWSKVSGPGTVNFSDPRKPDTTATFSKQGTYKLKLTANDGELTASDTVTIQYVQDGNGDTIAVAAPNTIPFEAENYAWLVGTAKKISDADASGGIAITAPEGMGNWAYTEYSLTIKEENYAYYLWIRAKGNDENSDSLYVSFKDDPRITVTTSSNAMYSWIKLPNSLSTPPGNWPLIIRSAEDGVTWDKLVITTDPFYDPTGVSINTKAIHVAIEHRHDDVEERAYNGYMLMDSSTLDKVMDGSTEQMVGLRFNSINIPSGATITKAYIQFTAKGKNSETTNLTIRGESKGNAAPFDKTNYDVSSRKKTSASVRWKPSPWNTRGESGPDQRTPDLSSVVQEIVSKSGWAANNSMVFIITGSGERVSTSFNANPDRAPKLYIEYSI